jgi:hypothetical protein
MNTKQRLVLAGCATIVLAWTAGFTPVDILTVQAIPTVASGSFDVRFVNAYASVGAIRQAVIADVSGRVLRDFTTDIDQQRRGEQRLTVDATDYPQGVVLVSVRCDGKTITEKVVIVR